MATTPKRVKPVKRVKPSKKMNRLLTHAEMADELTEIIVRNHARFVWIRDNIGEAFKILFECAHTDIGVDAASVAFTAFIDCKLNPPRKGKKK